jgi:hypothetical protein
MTLFAEVAGPLPHPEIPSPPLMLSAMPLWLLGLIALGGLLLIGIILWLIFKPKAFTPAAAERPVKQALKALAKLRADAPTLPPGHVGSQVSAVLRRYYLQRYGVPAPYRTSQELFPPGTAPEEGRQRKQWRERFDGLAEIYDTLEFSSAPATVTDSQALIDTAIARLEEERLQNHELA